MRISYEKALLLKDTIKDNNNLEDLGKILSFSEKLLADSKIKPSDKLDYKKPTEDITEELEVDEYTDILDKDLEEAQLALESKIESLIAKNNLNKEKISLTDEKLKEIYEKRGYPDNTLDLVNAYIKNYKKEESIDQAKDSEDKKDESIDKAYDNKAKDNIKEDDNLKDDLKKLISEDPLDGPDAKEISADIKRIFNKEDIIYESLDLREFLASKESLKDEKTYKRSSLKQKKIFDDAILKAQNLLIEDSKEDIADIKTEVNEAYENLDGANFSTRLEELEGELENSKDRLSKDTYDILVNNFEIIKNDLADEISSMDDLEEFSKDLEMASSAHIVTVKEKSKDKKDKDTDSNEIVASKHFEKVEKEPKESKKEKKVKRKTLVKRSKNPKASQKSSKKEEKPRVKSLNKKSRSVKTGVKPLSVVILIAIVAGISLYVSKKNKEE